MRRPALTRLLEWIPRTVSLGSGLHVPLRGRADAKHFREIFTSPEYLAFVTELARLQPGPRVVVDCGAAIGMFTLLMEHLLRIQVLRWEEPRYVLVEPAGYNLRRLRRNVGGNLPSERYEIHAGAVGRREGRAEFHEMRFTRWKRWGGSLHRRPEGLTRTVTRPYVDLAPHLAVGPVLLKIDVEGAEFELLREYREHLGAVQALLIEWHEEWGDVGEGEGILDGVGLRRVSDRRPGERRRVDLWVRERSGR